MRFEVFGPFNISRHGTKKLINKDSWLSLKSAVGDSVEGLSSAIGCYVFALRTGGGYMPYYVGQACKKSILDESMNSSNREKYNWVLDAQKGTPVLFLIPMRTPKGKFRKKVTVDKRLPSVDFLERWLIATAIDKNPKLVNNKETRFLRGIHVAGVFNAKQGEGTKSSAAFTKTLWR